MENCAWERFLAKVLSRDRGWPMLRAMDAVQLRLFPPAKPLLERFGKEFFRQIPKAPGVYIMSGERDRVLYIGQSGNLRARLSSYKQVQPERAPRRMVRLVHQVRSITWEVCESKLHAVLRENALLRLHKPRFNVMNTRPEHYAFVGYQWQQEQLELRLSKQPEADPSAQWYGAFKSLGLARSGYAALLRLWWAAHHQAYEPQRFPRILLAPKPPERFALPLRQGNAAAWGEGLEQFLAGQSDGLLQQLGVHEPPGGITSLFQVRMWEQDLERVQRFYQFGPQRCRRLCAGFGRVTGMIQQEELDDLMVRERMQTA